MVKSKFQQGAQGFVMLTFTTTTDFVSSEDAQADSRTTDPEDASIHKLSMEDANHQLSS